MDRLKRGSEGVFYRDKKSTNFMFEIKSRMKGETIAGGILI